MNNRNPLRRDGSGWQWNTTSNVRFGDQLSIKISCLCCFPDYFTSSMAKAWPAVASSEQVRLVNFALAKSERGTLGSGKFIVELECG